MEFVKGNFLRKVKKYGYDEIGQFVIMFNYLMREFEDVQVMIEGECRKFVFVIVYMIDGVIVIN